MTAVLLENPTQRVLAVPEDPHGVTLHQSSRHPPRAREVLDVIDDASGVAGRLEAVLVAPPEIRTGGLAILEAQAGASTP